MTVGGLPAIWSVAYDEWIGEIEARATTMTAPVASALLRLEAALNEVVEQTVGTKLARHVAIEHLLHGLLGLHRATAFADGVVDELPDAPTIPDSM